MTYNKGIEMAKHQKKMNKKILHTDFFSREIVINKNTNRFIKVTSFNKITEYQ